MAICSDSCAGGHTLGWRLLSASMAQPHLLGAKIGVIAWRHPAVPVHHLTFFLTLSYNNFLNIRDIKKVYIERLF